LKILNALVYQQLSTSGSRATRNLRTRAGSIHYYETTDSVSSGEKWKIKDSVLVSQWCRDTSIGPEGQEVVDEVELAINMVFMLLIMRKMLSISNLE